MKKNTKQKFEFEEHWTKILICYNLKVAIWEKNKILSWRKTQKDISLLLGFFILFLNNFFFKCSRNSTISYHDRTLTRGRRVEEDVLGFVVGRVRRMLTSATAAGMLRAAAGPAVHAVQPARGERGPRGSTVIWRRKF